MYNYNTIHEFIYDKKRQPKGVWVATPSAHNPNEIFIGFSLCNKSLGDKFDKDIGYNIARQRSYKASTVDIPDSLKEGYNFFFDRCKRYFKDRQVMV